MQCCTCYKWVHLNCSLLSFSRLRKLGSSHSWSCHPFCIPASSGDPTLTSTETSSLDSSSLYTSTAQSGPYVPSANVALPHHSCLLISYPLSTHFVSSLSAPSPSPHAPGCFSLPPAFSSLPWQLHGSSMECWGFQARSTELLHFISSHPVDLIYIQESNLNLSSFFRIPGFSALRSECILSRSGIYSTDVTDASGVIIIFVRQSLSFFKLSTSSLFSLDPYSDYVGVNISLNNSFSLSFLDVYALSIRSTPTDRITNSFSSSILPSSKNLFILGDFNRHHSLKN